MIPSGTAIAIELAELEAKLRRQLSAELSSEHTRAAAEARIEAALDARALELHCSNRADLFTASW